MTLGDAAEKFADEYYGKFGCIGVGIGDGIVCFVGPKAQKDKLPKNYNGFDVEFIELNVTSVEAQ